MEYKNNHKNLIAEELNFGKIGLRMKVGFTKMITNLESIITQK